MLNRHYIILIFFIILLPLVVFAQTDYTLLAPLPGGSEQIPAGTEGFVTYISQLFTFLLSAAAILALVMLVIGGLQYLGSAGNPQMISDAKGRITNALLGLLLAVAAWLILITINPALVSLNFVVTGVATSQADCTGLDEAACRKPGCSFNGGSCNFSGTGFDDSFRIPSPRLPPSQSSGSGDTGGLPPPPPPPPPPPNL